ncbi:MAG: Heimdall-CTERM domain-containing surface protein [Candidatus Hodarchaeales archaeon]
MSMQSSLVSVQAWSGGTHGKIATEAIKSLPSPWLEFFTDYENFFDAHANDPDGYRSDLEDSSFNRLFSIEWDSHFDDHNLKVYGGTVYDEQDPANDHLIDGEYTSEDLEFVAVNVSWDTPTFHKGVIEWRVLNESRDLTLLMEDIGEDPNNNTLWKLVFIKMNYLSHFAADSTMPFHAAANYDGQLTGQSGAHALFESSMMEQNTLDRVTFSNRPATYVDSVLNHSVYSIETSLANMSITLETEAAYPLDGSWVDNVWNDIGDIWGDRVSLAATSSADLWYTSLVDSDLINKVNATFLSSLSVDLSSPPPGWTTKESGSLWHPSFPPAPVVSTTTTTTTTEAGDAPGFELVSTLLILASLAIFITRKRK